MRKLTEREMNLWRKFKKQGGHSLSRAPVGGVARNKGWSFSTANTPQHECKKLIRAMECTKNDHVWLMEAVEIITNRRRDFVCLTEEIIYEIETDERRMNIGKRDGKYNSPYCDVEIDEIWEKKPFKT